MKIKKLYKMLFISIILLAVLIAVLVLSPKIQAVSFKGLSVFPASYEAGKKGSQAHFEYELYPGEIKQDTLRIVNNTGGDRTFVIFATDGTTTKDGAFALKGYEEEHQEVGTWISLDKKEVFIPNEDQAFIDFTIKIPQTAEVGDHLGGISVFSKEEEKKEGEGMVLTIKTRVGVRVYITVPGEIIKKLTVTEFNGQLDKTKDKVVFQFGLKNQGNVRLEPTGEIIAQSSFLNSNKTTFPINLRMVLPEKPTLVPVIWENTPLLGKYIVKADVKYGEEPSQVIHEEMEISFITKKAKILIGAGLLLLIITAAYLVKKTTNTKVKRR
jgi:hypothetical protein